MSLRALTVPIPMPGELDLYVCGIREGLSSIAIATLQFRNKNGNACKPVDDDAAIIPQLAPHCRMAREWSQKQNSNMLYLKSTLQASLFVARAPST